MERKVIPLVALTGALVALAGCAQPQPRYYSNQSGYYDRGYDQSSRNVCSNCGEVEGVQHIYVQDRTTGMGAVIGAVAGGLLGNTVGGGSGRQAATVAGAVAGGFAGNAIEKNNSGGQPAWQFDVRLDDGRRATVTQLDNPGFQRGDRVVIRGDHLEWQQRR